MIQPGIYKHFKGGTYTVLFTALDSTNGPTEDQPMVVYVAHKTGRVSVRLASQFNEFVEHEGKMVQRFVLEKAL